MARLILLATLLLATVSFVVGTDCKHRDFGNGATVCVCDEKHCDKVGPIVKTTKGEVVAYVSSKSGDRLAHHKVNLTKKVEHPNITISLDHKKTMQQIIGFGGAFTDSAGINIAKLPEHLQNQLIEDYFSKDGIEYTIGRVPIGGSDFSKKAYTYDDHPHDESLGTFALQEEDHKYKIPYIKMAQKVSPHKIRLFASPWSAPAWMKTNNELNHGGLLKGSPGGKYYKLFAKYFVRFLQEYHKQNVEMWGITITNEPGSGFNPHYKWNSLGFNSTLERDFIKLDLGPELHSSGFGKDKLKMMIHDDQLANVKQFATTVLSDKDAAKYVSGIAIHWYDNSHNNRHDLDDLVGHFHDQFILGTEACEEWKGKAQHVSLGNWATFNRYADDIINNVKAKGFLVDKVTLQCQSVFCGGGVLGKTDTNERNMNHFTSGWTDWNLVLDKIGGPNWVNNLVDAPIIVDGSKREYYKQPFFYAMGHFSKFLVPDSIRLHHDSQGSDPNVLTTVFHRPDNRTVLIVLNKNSHPVTLRVNDEHIGHFDAEVKADSMYNFIWN